MRKCMICGAELADTESCCGSCGAKAPGGAVDKEEAELKYITPNEENPPHWTMSWRFHDFLTEKYYRHLFSTKYRKISDTFSIGWDVWLLYSYMTLCAFLCFVGALDIPTPALLCGLHLVFALIYSGVFLLIFKTVPMLRRFKKNAPEWLYAISIIKIVAVSLYALILNFFVPLPIYVSIIAVVEICYSMLFLIITYLYYSKRAKAFIY